MSAIRSPLKAKPLRNPGQSVRRERIDIVFDKLMAPALVVIIFGTWAAIEWLRYYSPATSAPWLPTVLALSFLAYAFGQFYRYGPRLRALQLAEDGEKAVGQFLETLRNQRYQVFHDVVGTDFNVDHVLIGPAGVFTIETKTWNKPLRGTAEISFDGEILVAAGRKPDRDPVAQARAQAQWLKRLLEESTGKQIQVRPVILFPGWFVRDDRKNRRDLWVLEPKALPSFLENEHVQLAMEEVALISQHLSLYIRFQEKLYDAAK